MISASDISIIMKEVLGAAETLRLLYEYETFRRSTPFIRIH